MNNWKKKKKGEQQWEETCFYTDYFLAEKWAYVIENEPVKRFFFLVFFPPVVLAVSVIQDVAFPHS